MSPNARRARGVNFGPLSRLRERVRERADLASRAAQGGIDMTIPSAVKTFLFLTVSASALGAVIHFESTPARAAASVAAAPTPRFAPAAAPPAIHEMPVAAPAEAPA